MYMGSFFRAGKIGGLAPDFACRVGFPLPNFGKGSGGWVHSGE